MPVRISGLGGFLPPRVVTNGFLSSYLDTTPEWIENRTGIRERRFVDNETSTRDLAIRAGALALNSAGNPTIGAVVIATTSFDRLCPAVAPEVSNALELGCIPAYDMTSACSGFIYGLASSAGLIEAGIADRVLLIGAEAFTTMVNPDDRNTRPIFGDGAGAIVMERDLESGRCFAHFDMGSDGSLADLLAIPAGGSRQRARDGKDHQLAEIGQFYLHMEGRAIFQQAVERMSASSRNVMKRFDLAVDDIDWFVGHQANSRILYEVASNLGIPTSRIALNIHRTGNTLTASIPLLLADLAASGALKPKQRVLLSAFGAGLSWGSTIFSWPDIPVVPVA